MPRTPEKPLKGSGATFYAGRYRLLLWRRIHSTSPTKPLMFVMLNPSMADEEFDDLTVKKCSGFAHRNGALGLVVVNLSPLIATRPESLIYARAHRIDVLCFEQNRLAWLEALEATERTVFAWGSSAPGWLVEAAAPLLALVPEDRRYCLGKTSEGQPRHPSRLAYATSLEPFA